MIIMQLWRELTRLTARDYLPHIPRHFSTAYDPRDISPDEQLILMHGERARDPHIARRLLADNGGDIRRLDLTHQRPKPNKRQRFINLLRRWEGSTPTDVTINSFLNRQAGRPTEYGVYTVPFDESM